MTLFRRDTSDDSDSVIAMPHNCPQCSAPLDMDAVFCSSCAAPVTRCPGCGKPISLGPRFCKYCAFDLAKVPAFPSPQPSPDPQFISGFGPPAMDHDSAQVLKSCPTATTEVEIQTQKDEYRIPESVDRPIGSNRQLKLCFVASLVLSAFREFVTPYDLNYVNFWFTTLPRFFGGAIGLLLLPAIASLVIALITFLFNRRWDFRSTFIPFFWVFGVLMLVGTLINP